MMLNKIDDKKRVNFLVSNEFYELLEQLTLLHGGNTSRTVRTCIYDFVKRNNKELIT
jgi:hypothetical protein